MKRREFLGASGAGLIVASTARATTILDTSGKLIESMTASTSRGDHHARSPPAIAPGQGDRLEVQIEETVDSMIVRIRAPDTELRAVTMSLFPNNAVDLVLNDHWERTYGDVGWHKPSPDEQLRLVLPCAALELVRGVRSRAPAPVHSATGGLSVRIGIS